MQAVILAGGLGTRLRPLTYEVPKPMITVKGKPFLEHQLELLRSYKITDILLLVGYLEKQIRDYFKDGSDFGVKIQYSVEDKPLGEAGALKKAEALLKEEFFVVYGDSYLSLDYGDVELYFKKAKKRVLMVVYDNKNEDTGVPNNVSLDKDLIVTSYKKGDRSDTSLQFVEAGVLAFRKEVLALVEPDRAMAMDEAVFFPLIDEGELLGYISPNRFYDIGTPERIEIIEEIL